MGTPPPRQSEPLLVVILGPTGSGKSALAIALAQQFAGEMVSCDSVAIYRHFEIGTAKPTPQQRALAPHHLLDVAEPGQPFTAGEYARQARAAIAEIAASPAAAHRGWRHGPLSASAAGRALPRDRNVRKNCASAFANARRNAARLICTSCSLRLDPAAAAKIHPQ